MRLTSTLLSSLARSVGLARPENNDTDIQIPNAILPVASIPEAITAVPQPIEAATTQAVQLSSGTSTFTKNVAAAGSLAETRILNLGSGLWEVFWDVSLTLPALVDEIDAQFQMVTPSGGLGGWKLLLIVGTVIAPARYYSGHFRILIPNGHRLVCSLEINNGAGTTELSWFGNFLSNKLVG